MALLKNKKSKPEKPKTKSEYDKYRDSKEWKHIRNLVLDRDGHKCRTCGAKETERELHVHHSTYEHIYDELNHLDDLITLCSVCHRGLHNKYNFKRFKKPNQSK